MTQEMVLDKKMEIEDNSPLDGFIYRDIRVNGVFHLRTASAVVDILSRYNNGAFEVYISPKIEKTKKGYQEAKSMYNLMYLLSSEPITLSFRAKGEGVDKAFSNLKEKLDQVVLE